LRGNFMAGKNTAVFGIYQSQPDVEYAVDALRSEGFRNTDISVLFADNKGTKDFAVEKNTKAPEGTAVGATTGGVIGGVLGWLAGIWYAGDSRCWPTRRRRTDCGCSDRHWCGRHDRRHSRCPDWHGLSGIRSQAVRRTYPKRRDSTQRALRRFQLDKKSKGNFGAHRCYGHCKHWRSSRRLAEDRQATASRKLKPEASRLQMPGGVLLQAALAPSFKARFMADFSVLALAAHDPRR